MNSFRFIHSPSWRGKAPRRFGVFACFGILLSSCSSPLSAGGSQNVPSDEPSNSAHGNSESFRKNLSNSLKGGISLSADVFDLQIGANDFSFAGANLNAKIDGLSLHKTSLTAEIPVSYNGLDRSLSASLIEDELYLAIDSDPSEANYEFRYKVDLSSYDVEESGSSIEDPTTGGIVYYEFGRLDWIIDDLLEILSQNGMSTSLSLQSGNDLSFSSEDLLSSLENMKETARGGTPYFEWDFCCNGTTYPIGLSADENYVWNGIDFPAKGDSGVQNAFVFDSGDSLQISCAVNALSSYSFSAPSNASSYCDLHDSIGLFEQIADLCSKQQLSVAAFHEESGAEIPGLLLHHHEDEVTGEKVTHKDAIDEDAVVSLSSSIDLKGGKLNAIEASFGISSDSKQTNIEFDLVGEDGSRTAYLDANHGCMKFKTPVSVFDGMSEVFEELLSDADLTNEYLSRLFATSNAISKAIDAIKASAVLTDAGDGHYESALSMLTSLRVEDDSIAFGIDLSNLALSGSADVLLTGSSRGLAEIVFHSLSIAGFTLNGGIRIGAYVPSSFEDDGTYPELTHIPSLVDQLSVFAKSDSINFTVEGFYLKGGTTAVSTDPRYTLKDGSPVTQQGFTFKGEGGFNLKTKQGSGTVTAIDRKEEYLNEHHVEVEIEGPEATDEDGNSIEADEDDSSTRNNMLFRYSSENNYQEGLDSSYYGSSSEPSNDPLYGRFSIHSLNSLLGLIEDLSSTDDRFSRITSGLFSTGGTTLLSALTEGKYMSLLTAGIVKSCSIDGATDRFAISKDLLGTASDIDLTLTFEESGSKQLKSLSLYVELSGDGEENSILSIEIGISIPESPLTDSDLAISDLRSNKSTMTDYSSLKTMIEYLLGSANLGADAYGVSVYHLTGSATIALGSLFSLNVSLNFYVTVEGAEVQVMGSIDAPTFLSVNQPTTGLSSGHVYTDFYFHTSGTDEGEFYFRRTLGINPESSRSQDEARVSLADFSSNMLDWILGYFLNLSQSMMDNITSSDSSTSSKAMHGEDLILSFGFNDDFASPSWDLKIGMSTLTGSSVLGDLTVTIGGKTVDVAGTSEKTLNAASGSFKVASVLTVSFDLALANVSTGTYLHCWGANDSSEAIDLHYLNVYTSKILFITTTHKDVETESGYAKSFYESRFFQNGSYVSAITSLSYTATPTISSY